MRRFTKPSAAVTVAIGAATLIALGGCTKAPDPWDKVEGGKVKVLVSFPPLYCFVKAVADKDAKVETICAAVGPHDHTATATDAHWIKGADLLLINGLSLDESISKAVKSSGNKKIKTVEVAEDALSEKQRLKMGAHDHGHEHPKDKDHAKDKDHGHEHHHHAHGEWDPHAWLGIEQAILMVELIRDELKKADAGHAADYDRRAGEYVEKLKKLQADGKKMLADKKNRKLIAMHDSLAYFCKSFDLEFVDSIMPRPGVEADGKKLAELVEKCKSQGVGIIAVEPQYSQSRAKTLADNLSQGGHKLAIVTIDPLETAPRNDLNADYYLTVMQRNLDNLAKEMK